ncbi:sigma 54-interacting transcriptional regulator [Petroclostridium sp. X23]|uniref:sigma 54-interacting transcriptional regulator n=1 Tax=Petroclostridium sp. X23 TaxID=3045146 RepID=UPI0024AD8154|nr:sigma 54-interacting transcriptional regulator [Petroclostridium sp. X23]WHH57843.1 sigma 54-interacting transcriptional regulator [Petroclostridium sp. X23]
MQRYKIGCLTYKRLDLLVQNVIKKNNDPDLELYTLYGIRDELVEQVNKELRNGTDVFIGGGANAEYVMKATEANVIKIKLNAMDYLEAIFKAIKVDRNIAIVNYIDEPRHDFKNIEHHFSIKIFHIIYSSTEELEFKLREIDANVVIGAGLAVEISNRIGKNGILIYPGEETIANAIMEAKDLAVAVRKERERSNFIKAIIELSPVGIILANEESKIITYNSAAEKVVGISMDKARGNYAANVVPECNLDEIIKEGQPADKIIREINDNKVVVSTLPIDDGKKVIGALAMLSPVSDYFRAEKKAQAINNEKGFKAKNSFRDILGKSDNYKSAIEQAKIFAKSDSNILITGETGVGKEMFAQSIHNFSFRNRGPFVAINCSALPENLLESELFGYEEGAFTGSKKGGKVGLFEIANGGTLLLDEIGELSINLQARLLRVIQEKEVMRVGGDRIIPIDVRIISATNKNLENASNDEFRRDLLYRLNVLQLQIPSLKERDDDVIYIFNALLNKKVDVDDYKLEIPVEILKILTMYSWPGNIRELQNVCERFYLFFSIAKGTRKIKYHDILVRAIGEERLLLDVLRSNGISDTEEGEKKGLTKELLEKLEFIFPYSKEVLAKKIGISRTTLWRINNER